MKVFLSWSGDRSKRVAIALRNWLPLVLQYVQPWLSDQDIHAGERWANEVSKELESSNFGIICLTPENLASDWILFEAGALSKAIQASAACPYLFDLELKDVSGPLSQFQGKKAERRQTLELIETINSRSTAPLDLVRLREVFEMLWPKMEQHLAQIPPANLPRPITRTAGQILEELVGTVRSFDQRLSAIEGRTLLRSAELQHVKAALRSLTTAVLNQASERHSPPMVIPPTAVYMEFLRSEVRLVESAVHAFDTSDPIDLLLITRIDQLEDELKRCSSLVGSEGILGALLRVRDEYLRLIQRSSAIPVPDVDHSP